jgi:hypothetical protein
MTIGLSGLDKPDRIYLSFLYYTSYHVVFSFRITLTNARKEIQTWH